MIRSGVRHVIPVPRCIPGPSKTWNHAPTMIRAAMHLFPKKAHRSFAIFEEDRAVLTQALRNADPAAVSIYRESRFNPYPFAVEKTALDQLHSITRVLAKAISAVVVNYKSDGRVRRLLGLSKPVERLLEPSLVAVSQQGIFVPGSWRPDFLHDLHGSPKICEINARFAWNGFLSSAAVTRVVPSSLPFLLSRDCLPSGGVLLPVQGLNAVTSQLSRLFHGKGAVGIVKRREGGWDVHVLYRHWTTSSLSETPSERGPPQIRFVSPRDLKLIELGEKRRGEQKRREEKRREEKRAVERSHSGRVALGDSVGIFSSLIWELHQDEYFTELSPDVRDFVSRHSRLRGFGEEERGEEKRGVDRKGEEEKRTEQSFFSLNSLIDVFMVHDKRLLAVFSHPSIMLDYLSHPDVSLLQRHIVPTTVLGPRGGEAGRVAVQRAMSDPAGWVLKPSLLGKGEGMIFGAATPAPQWQGLLNAWTEKGGRRGRRGSGERRGGEDETETEGQAGGYVLQPFIQQKIFPVWDPRLAGSAPAQPLPMHVVGLLPCCGGGERNGEERRGEERRGEREEGVCGGPGIYRAAVGALAPVNVSGGRGIILPSVVLSSK